MFYGLDTVFLAGSRLITRIAYEQFAGFHNGLLANRIKHRNSW